MTPNLVKEEKVIKKKTLKKSSKVSSNNLNNEDTIFVFHRFEDIEMVDKLESYQKVIHQWESNLVRHKHHFYLFEDHIDDARNYLSAVDGILQLMEDEVEMSDAKLVGQVDSVIQTAMLRLEDEFRHLLVKNVVSLDGDQICGRICGSVRRISLSSTSTNVSEDFDSIIDDHESEADDLCLDLVDSDAVVDLNSIAERMTKAGYENECCQVYSNIRSDAVLEYLSIFGVEKIGIEEVQKLEWGLLDEKIKKWIQAVKNVARYLLSEKQLCDHVFGSAERPGETCFMEIAKDCMMQLLSFGEAVLIVERSPEKLFRILDMYEALGRLDLKALFVNQSSDFVCTEAQRVLDGLGEAAKGTFMEFELAVKSESSRRVTLNGEIHPLVRYVTNYMKLVVDYGDSLNLLLKDSTDISHRSQGDDGDMESVLGRRLLVLISCLESNLEDKSKQYEDGALRYVFLMNNILYIVHKVKDSELGKILGDQCVRRRRSQVRQYATCYLRASWSKLLSFLKDEGLVGRGSLSNVSLVALKERFKNFNAAFEEIYKNQSAWRVPDPQLRDELRMLISERVLPAYRAFMGRFRSHLERGRSAGKYIKYTPEDMDNYLLDLFEGTPRDLHNPKRKHS